MSDSKKWETKDIVYLFVISILVQFIFYYFSFIYGGSVKALGYISFAGTLVSILLAVIAIGYTYGESIRQKGSQDELINQIRDLTEIKENLGSQVNVLENIANLKKTVDEKMDESINLIKNNLGKYKDPEPSVTSEPITEKNTSNFLLKTNQTFDTFVLRLHKILSKNEIYDFDKLVDEVFANVRHHGIENSSFAFAKFESVMATYSVLDSLGLVRNYHLNENVIDILKSKYAGEGFKGIELTSLLKEI